MVEVFLATALICFESVCYPTIVGKDTPKGEYTLQQYLIRDPRYGGDVLEFKRDGAYAYSVHRTWPGRERLYSKHPSERRGVSKGCINVEPEVYSKLVACCTGSTILIR